MGFGDSTPLQQARPIVNLAHLFCYGCSCFFCAGLVSEIHRVPASRGRDISEEHENALKTLHTPSICMTSISQWHEYASHLYDILFSDLSEMGVTGTIPSCGCCVFGFWAIDTHTHKGVASGIAEAKGRRPRGNL